MENSVENDLTTIHIKEDYIVEGWIRPNSSHDRIKETVMVYSHPDNRGNNHDDALRFMKDKYRNVKYDFSTVTLATDKKNFKYIHNNGDPKPKKRRKTTAKKIPSLTDNQIKYYIRSTDDQNFIKKLEKELKKREALKIKHHEDEIYTWGGKEYKIVPFKDDRFKIIDETAKTVDDCSGWGYKSIGTAKRMGNYRFGGGKEAIETREAEKFRDLEDIRIEGTEGSYLINIPSLGNVGSPPQRRRSGNRQKLA